MTRSIRIALMLAGTIAGTAACHKKLPPAGAKTTPVTDTDAAARERARQDSIRRAEQARRDSIDRANRANQGTETPPGPTTRTVEEMRRILAQPVYFDLDKSDLTESSRAALDAKIEILRDKPEIKIRINGHTDDRGSDEYNLALGMRRAAATKEYLITHGIDASRFEVQSFGAEQPAAEGQNEEAWAKNRRCEFEIQGLK
jgi:peptidoglycan-associated lipoprotein